MRSIRLRLGLTAFLLVLSAASAPLAGTADTLPASLTDQQFWALTQRFSEPNGYFRSQSGSTDNLLSNENTLSTVAAELEKIVKPSGVYLGVGPEQNFTYIAAIKPRLAIITDIRRGNLQLHLLYKALFETTANRADFVGRLFSRTRPAGLSATATAGELLAAYQAAPPVSDAAFTANLDAVMAHLTKTRKLPLDADDVAGIAYVYGNFYKFGPDINYSSTINGRSGGQGSYARILAVPDRALGTERSYLATEANFTIIKGLEAKNLIVPIVGDFAGPKALRAVAAYLKEHGAVVSAFYVSNVEDYLQRNGVMGRFCANVAAMPLDPASTFIRPSSRAGFFGSMMAEAMACRQALPS
ncbi:MAG TPA: hypothetical protein VFV78_09905 [Vicinamibacterales bacterium]|nr:hypothetical protein [Vicinamibacterales bacterium]